MKKIVLILVLFSMVPLTTCYNVEPKSCEEFIGDSPDDLVCNPATGKKIYFFNHEELGAFTAESVCMKKGGHLVTIEDESEAEFLLTEMEKRSAFNITYTGLIDFQEDGEFTYITGIPGFLSGSILTEDESPDENKYCGTLETEGFALEVMIARNCHQRRVSICEFEYFDDSIIFIPTSGVHQGWKEATRICSAAGGGEIVTIDTVQKSAFLTQSLQKRAVTRAVTSSIWVGMYYHKKDEKFRWRSGSHSVYRKWCRGEPKLQDENGASLIIQCVSYTVPKSESEININIKTKGCLKIEPCHLMKEYACEIKSEWKQEPALLDHITETREKLRKLRSECKFCKTSYSGLYGAQNASLSAPN